ncbi:hypothetical protein LCGC14_0566840 [marine sediment metagenome]|uniref:Uncharacterized protein n=1 Tax=marine sediment metagenome TaxID=412755 RepID=A0A0F9S3X8_9ZZZZ
MVKYKKKNYDTYKEMFAFIRGERRNRATELHGLSEDGSAEYRKSLKKKQQKRTERESDIKQTKKEELRKKPNKLMDGYLDD